MKKLISVACLLALPCLASAEVFGPRHQHSQKISKLSAVALNGAAGTRTFTADVEGWDMAVFYLFFDYTATAGTITLTCTVGPDTTTYTYTPQVCTLSGGTCTGADSGIFTHASMSADTRWSWRMGVRGYRYMSCVAAHGGTPAATDKITVDLVLVAE